MGFSTHCYELLGSIYRKSKACTAEAVTHKLHAAPCSQPLYSHNSHAELNAMHLCVAKVLQNIVEPRLAMCRTMEE